MTPPPPPMAIPFIVAYAASAAVVAAEFAILGLTVATTASLVGGLASIATSMLMKSAEKSDGPQIASNTTQPGAGRAQQFRQPTPPHEVVVGRIKKSGPVMFMASRIDDDEREDGYFYLDIALAAHECYAIGDIYFADEVETDPKFTGYYTVGRHLGTADQVEDATFLADLPTDFADHWLRGRTHICVRLKGNGVPFPNGVPSIAAIIWGTNGIYDPRTALSGWHNNAILIVAWWMMWGEGYSIEDFDLDSLIAAANVCDERVGVYGGTCTFTVNAGTEVCTLSDGARSLDVGDGVRVSTSGVLPGGLSEDTTYYIYPHSGGTVKLCATVADAFAGISVDITSSGSGTQTLQYWDEARYKCNGSFTLDSEKREIREQLLTACAGQAFESGGLWFLHAAAALTPSVTLDEDDLRDAMVTVPKRSMRDKINTVRAVYVDPDNGWQPVDAPPLTNADYLEEDNGVELPVTIRLPFTISGRCSQRLQKMTLEQNHLAQRSVKYPAKLTAMRLRPLDGCYLNNDRYGWDAEPHRVMGWVLAEDGGIDLMLQQDDPAIYAWDANTDENVVLAPQGITLPNPSEISAPASIIVATPLTPVFSRLNATIAEVKSIWFDGYDVEFKSTELLTWSSNGRIQTNLISVIMAEATDIQARAVTKNGTASAFTQNIAPGTPTDVVVDGMEPLQINWTNGLNAAQVQVFQGDGAFSESILFATETATGSLLAQTLIVENNKNYWLRTINSTGNVSHTSSAVTVGTAGPPTSDGGDGDGGGGDGGDGGGDGGDD